MKHKIIGKLSENGPYEIIQVEIIAKSSVSEAAITNYLTFQLEAIDVLSNSGLTFVIKRAKPNLGI